MGGVALTFPNACLIVAVSRLRRGRTGVQCHRESSPLTLDAVLLDRHTLIQACVICHCCGTPPVMSAVKSNVLPALLNVCTGVQCSKSD